MIICLDVQTFCWEFSWFVVIKVMMKIEKKGFF